MTLDVAAIFTRVDTLATACFESIKVEVNGVGLLSTRIAMVSMSGRLELTVIGTTAPFSAISGTLIWMSGLSMVAEL